ncbi:thermonuclease family protein [Magnetovibrio sp. PR-2]|uniref:thermonuclease family protein n=1 Tax=Magnetovibrio sp. PR-2 TaxID=3120356 RepID=UPI003FA53A09
MDIRGKARIVDGDTLWIDKTKIRLHGIDTPEMKQLCTLPNGSPYSCGNTSSKVLASLVQNQSIVCEGLSYDRYKRLIARCYAGAIELNHEMVRQGWALAYVKYSNDYVAAEKEARKQLRGLWSGRFERPWEWRK